MNTPNPQYDGSAGIQQDGLNIDYKRIIGRALQYWYVVALSLAIALVICYFKTRYAVRVYPITASILIKEKEETSEGRLLYNNPLVSGFRNYLNELYIIRSYPLIERTIEELNFGVGFYKEGNVLTTEIYEVPVTAKVISYQLRDAERIYFKPVSNEQFQLTLDGDHQNTGKSETFNFGDTVSVSGLKAIFSWKGDRPRTMDAERLIFAYRNPSEITGSFVSRLKASWAEEGAGVINLSVEGTNPNKEIDFLNGLIRQYQLYDLEKKNRAATRTIDFITEQLTGIKDSLFQVERQLQRFKDENTMTTLSEEASRLYEKLEKIEAERAELIIRGNYYQYLEDYLNRNSNLDQVILPTSIGINDPVLSTMISKMIDIQMQMKMSTKSENPLVAEGKRRINELRSDILESVKNQEGTDKIRQNYVDKQVKDIEKQLNGLPLAERQMVSIQRNYSLLENLYIFLLQKKAEAGISKAATTTDIVVVNPPMLSGGPISPQPLKNYAIAILIGLGLPALCFVLIEVTNNKVQSKEDIERITSIPFIGGVGHKRTENNLEVLNAPKSAVAESFRALRSNLNYFTNQKQKAVFLITSSISGEGKTFTSLNLASVFALSQKKTLIIGADMRRPKIFSDFNLTNDEGLSNYLAGISDFDKVVQPTSNNYLDLISGGPVPPNPSELLLTPRMAKFMEEAKKRYDYVIIDTPPLAIVADAFVLTEYSDHTLFLVRQNYTPKALIRTVRDFHTSGKLKNISIVLNDIYRSGPGYGYGYGYSYGYGYGYGYGNKKNGYGYYDDETA